MPDACSLLSQVIVTSYLFPDGNFSLKRLQTISSLIGKNKLVVDVRHVVPLTLGASGSHDQLSCRRRGDGWFVAMNKWQDITTMEVNKGKHGTLYPFLGWVLNFVLSESRYASTVLQVRLDGTLSTTP
jgi:hypothetical protein